MKTESVTMAKGMRMQKSDVERAAMEAFEQRECIVCGCPDMTAENERLRELLRVAHTAALQGGWNTSDPDDRRDMADVRVALGWR